MFYSQMFDKPTQENLCVKCETRFTQWAEYHKHVTEVQCIKLIKPIRTTSRTKVQIVADVESMGILKGRIIE